MTLFDVPFGVVQMYVGRRSTFMSRTMIPLRSEAKSFSITQIGFNLCCLC